MSDTRTFSTRLFFPRVFSPRTFGGEAFVVPTYTVYISEFPGTPIIVSAATKVVDDLVPATRLTNTAATKLRRSRDTVSF